MLKDTISNIFSQHKTNINKHIMIIFYLKLTYMFEMTKYMFEIVDLHLENAYTKRI